MKRKYADAIQHTIYRDGWKDALHEVGGAVDRAKQAHLGCACDGLEGHIREELGRIVEQMELVRT